MATNNDSDSDSFNDDFSFSDEEVEDSDSDSSFNAFLKDDFTFSVEAEEEALAFAVSVGDKDIQISANQNLAKIYERKGDHQKAIKHHERVAQISKDIGSKDEQAKAYGSLGNNYESLGNYHEAIKYQTKCLEMCVAIGHSKGAAGAHGNIGSIYNFIGQYDEAIKHTKKSLSIARQIYDRCYEGIALGSLGTSLMLKDELKDAVPCFEECLEIALEVNDKHTEGITYINLALCKITLGQYKEALKMFDKQIRLAENIGDKANLSAGYNKQGIVYLELKNHQKALQCFENGLKIAKEMDNKELEASSHRSLAVMYQALYGLDLEKNKQCLGKSIHHTKESLRCTEWLFDHLGQDHLKISILETFKIDYNALSFNLIHNKDSKGAFLASERGRARALDDLLVLKYNLNQDKQSRRDLISYAEIMKLAGSECSILFYSWQSHLHYAWVTDSVDTSPLSIRIDEAGFSEVVSNVYDTLNVRGLPCEDRSIQNDEPQDKKKSGEMAVTEKLLLSIEEKNKKRCIFEEDLYDNDNPNPLENLYQVLISPVLHLLNKDEIVIIPDGSLFKVPFATLRDPNTGQFLSETKRIRLAPSLTSLKTLKDCPADFHSKTGALIIGNPKVGKVAFRGKTRTIADLPCAEREARKIGDLLGVKPFIGLQATKDTIKQSLQEGVAVIHFAAHGTTDGEIFLTPSSTEDLPSEQDYILTMKEVQESGVRPQLVVLSCCHSGRGEIKAEGVVGMSRAFLAAGARAVIASLWAIADEATMVFMEKFYTHLKHGESASQSLQAAMKDMRKTPRYSDEQFWGPFFLIGDDVTIKL